MIVETELLRWILILPLVGVFFNVFLGDRLGRGAVGFVAPGVIGIAFLLTTIAFFQLLELPPGAALVDRMFPWIDAGNVHVHAGLRFDALSAVMTLVVTGVGCLIHVYSVGYMSHEPDHARFFAYLNLFMLSMLLLVLSENLILLFVGWEGVGACSYLLIGFWYSDDANAAAGKKAFIVNRVGDAGFLLGGMLLFWTYGAHGVWSFDFAVLKEASHHVLTPGIATIAALCFFVGATGKSAQLPLYVWLPDAMAGPTPVSALIHAATMVTAGIYLIARMSFLFAMSPTAMAVIATVGAATAIFAATIGLVQNDIKKVLAYSTVSQLGYMFLAMGVGAYAMGIFHVMTHAFFKALLFMGAGSVIHAMGDEQDIRKMGGLKDHMPVTFATFAIGCLAIAGVPGLAGFFSKDAILFNAATSEHGHWLLWAVGIFGAALTAFYMFRLLFLTFFGECRADEHTKAHLHESPANMTGPLVVLAFLSVVGGWVGLPPFLLWGDQFGAFLDPIVGVHGAHHAHHSLALELGLMAVSIAAAFGGIALAFRFYMQGGDEPAELSRRFSGVYERLENKYWVDEAYDAAIVQPIYRASTWLWSFIDATVIDGIVNGVAEVVRVQSEVWRRLQSGNVQHYALSFVVGVIALIGAFVMVP